MTKDINFCIGFIESYLMEMNTSEETKEVCKTVTEILKKAEKYRWHDLRKNPDDLPTKKRSQYLTFDGIGYGTAVYGYVDRNGNERGFSRCNVIAWREIEPFEEEVE